MSCFDFFRKKKQLLSKKNELKKEDFRVSGVEYYLKNLHKLSTVNPKYSSKLSCDDSDGRIYRYTYINKPVRLIEEPNNAHDKNAIMVVVAGELVGYIRAEECLHVKQLLHNHEIKYISSFITGGKYKMVSSGSIVSKDEISICVSVRICYIS